MWPFAKPEEEIYIQRVYDAYYSQECPVCKTMVADRIHKIELIGIELVPSFDSQVATECPKCHVAVFTQRNMIIVKLQKYLKKSSAVFGLEKISEEVLK